MAISTIFIIFAIIIKVIITKIINANIMVNNELNNPFVILKSIPEELFCDRKEETAFLIKQIENGRNTVLVSPRRMGKTGLIHHLLCQQEIRDKYNTFFIDIYAASNMQEMCYIFGKAVFERLKSKKTQYWESFFQTIKSLRPAFKINTVTGEPSFELGIGAIESPATTLEEIFSYLETSDKPCLVAFDEFQQIAEFQENRVEALLRGMIQNCTRTMFLFSGSKQHTISQMFHSKARPFYQSAQLMDLNPLNRDVYADFATRLFERYDKHLNRSVVYSIYDDYFGTTWYMQMLMNELFSITRPGETCTEEDITLAKQNIIDVQEGVYLSQLSMLSPRQKQLMQAIAKEGAVRSVTSSAFIKKYSLDSASSVQSALKGLSDKDILSAIDGEYRISDFFFGEWLRKNY